MRVCATIAMGILFPAVTGCQLAPRLDDFATFGAPQQPERTVTLAKAVKIGESGTEEPVWVRARIGDVCGHRGCWLRLSDGRRNVRVRFTTSEQCTDGFLVPRNAAGHEAYVHGIVKRTTIPEELARHYAEEAGKDKEDIEKIVGPQPAYSMLATSVLISDKSALDPPAE